MQIKSKWTMQNHFKYIHIKTFLMLSWGPIWYIFAFPTKAMNICNSHTSVIPKVGMHLGVIGFHPLHSPPFVKVCFALKHIIGLMGPCISHLVENPMLGLWHNWCCMRHSLAYISLFYPHMFLFYLRNSSRCLKSLIYLICNQLLLLVVPFSTCSCNTLV
jgi:hypothetical protein